MPPKKAKTVAQQQLKVQRAAADVKFAALEATAAASAAEVKALQAQLAALVVSAPRLPRRTYRGLTAALSDSLSVSVCSPSKKGHLATGEQRLLPNFANFEVCAVPLTTTIAPLSAATSLAAWNGLPSNYLLDEKQS